MQNVYGVNLDQQANTLSAPPASPPPLLLWPRQTNSPRLTGPSCHATPHRSPHNHITARPPFCTRKTLGKPSQHLLLPHVKSPAQPQHTTAASSRLGLVLRSRLFLPSPKPSIHHPIRKVPNVAARDGTCTTSQDHLRTAVPFPPACSSTPDGTTKAILQPRVEYRASTYNRGTDESLVYRTPQYLAYPHHHSRRRKKSKQNPLPTHPSNGPDSLCRPDE